LTATPDEQEARINAVAVDVIAIRDSLPRSFPSVSDIAAEVRKLNELEPEQVAGILGAPEDSLKLSVATQTETLALILARLDFVEQILTIDGGSPLVPPERGDVVARSNGLDVYFSTNSAELTHASVEAISTQGRIWARTGRRVEVVGYADARGTAELNEALSLRRASAVADALSSVGVIVDRVVGAGVDPSTADLYTRARRVRVNLVGPAGTDDR
jgi:outer membrane protein OmpA-like peptidoglycan-associated protein